MLVDHLRVIIVGASLAGLTYRIRYAQFDQRPGVLEPARRPVRLGPHLFVCGDHVENTWINGAMASGRRAAEAVLAKGAMGLEARGVDR